MRFVTGFGRFWWDFIVGDDWRIAAGVLATLTLGAMLTATQAASDAVIGVLVTAGIVAAVAVALFAPAGRR